MDYRDPCLQIRVASEPLPVAVISEAAKKRLKGKHPWIFSNELVQRPSVSAGELIDIHDPQGHSIGVGYYNPQTLIAVRILSFHGKFDIAERIRRAHEVRKKIYSDSVYRLVFSESDFLPGLIVDRYSETLVLQILTAGMERMREQIIAALTAEIQPQRILLRNDSPYRKLEGLDHRNEWIFGDAVDAEWIEVDGLKFFIPYEQGQKTGFFLDHRANRNRLRSYGPAESLLDVFSYTGAWSVYGASAGIRNITAVDSSREALDLALKNAAANGYSITTIVSAADDFLRAAVSGTNRYARIILDPPAFAKSKRHLTGAVRAYREINLRAMKCLAPGGLLFTCSCSHPMTPELFSNILQQAAAASGRQFYLREMLFQPPDHPILMGFPESHYLKCAILEHIQTR